MTKSQHTVEVPSAKMRVFFKNLQQRCEALEGSEPSVTIPIWEARFAEDDDDIGVPNHWSPYLGVSLWKYQGNEFEVQLFEEGKPGYNPSKTHFDVHRRLRIKGSEQKLVEAFVGTMLRKEDTPALDSKGRVRTWTSNSRGDWVDRGYSPAQSFEDLYLPPKSVADLQARIAAFEASAERNIQLGRMHKLGMLLMGVPGAGKSSLVRALARKYSKELYVLTFGRRMDDEVLEELIECMDGANILLVEDFDSLGFSQSSKKKNCKDESMHNVTRSFFLNVLDGVLRPPSGTMICLTSNTCSGLDKALVRPGRIDLIMRFGEPKEPEVMKALQRLTEPEKAGNVTTFCAKLRKFKKGSLCMSGLVDYLLRHPKDYLEAFEELAARCIHGDEMNEDDGPVNMYM